MWFSDAWCGVRWVYWGLAWIDIFSNCRIWVDLEKNSSVEGRKMLRKCFCTENSSAWFVGSITFLQDSTIHLNFRTSKPELLHVQKISYAAAQHQNIDKWSAGVNHCNSLIQLWAQKKKYKTSYSQKNVKKMYRVSPVIFGFLKKKSASHRRKSEPLHWWNLPPALGRSPWTWKKCGFPMAFPKKSWDTHRKIEMLGETCLEIVKKNILSRSYRLWASQNAPEFSNSCLVGKVQWRFRWQPYPLPLESPPVVPLSPKHHPETVPLLNGGHLTLWQCSKLEKHHFQSVNQPK